MVGGLLAPRAPSTTKMYRKSRFAKWVKDDFYIEIDRHGGWLLNSFGFHGERLIHFSLPHKPHMERQPGSTAKDGCALGSERPSSAFAGDASAWLDLRK